MVLSNKNFETFRDKSQIMSYTSLSTSQEGLNSVKQLQNIEIKQIKIVMQQDKGKEEIEGVINPNPNRMTIK